MKSASMAGTRPRNRPNVMPSAEPATKAMPTRQRLALM